MEVKGLGNCQILKPTSKVGEDMEGELRKWRWWHLGRLLPRGRWAPWPRRSPTSRPPWRPSPPTITSPSSPRSQTQARPVATGSTPHHDQASFRLTTVSNRASESEAALTKSPSSSFSWSLLFWSFTGAPGAPLPSFLLNNLILFSFWAIFHCHCSVYQTLLNQSINQSIFISGLYTYMLMFYHSEQSMDSHRQAYFHDRPNILSVQINVKNLSQEYNIHAIYTMFRKSWIIRVSSILCITCFMQKII